MKFNLILNLLYLLLPIFTVQAEVRSWCDSKRLNAAEQTICGSEELRELDSQLGIIYGRSKASAEDYSQIEWLKNRRDSCNSNEDCIANEYRSRIASLLQHLNQTDPESARPWCVASGLNITERTICTTSSLRDLDAQLQVAYGQAMAALDDGDQMYWLRQQRDACGQDIPCISKQYEDRISQLKKELNGNNDVTSTRNDCSQNKINELKAVCVISAVGEQACSSTLYDHLPNGALSSASTSAVCNAAASHLIDGSIDPNSIGLSMASGFLSGAGDSLLESHDTSNIFFGVLFKAGSLFMTLDSIGQCFKRAEHVCY